MMPLCYYALCSTRLERPPFLSLCTKYCKLVNKWSMRICAFQSIFFFSLFNCAVVDSPRSGFIIHKTQLSKLSSLLLVPLFTSAANYAIPVYVLLTL